MTEQEFKDYLKSIHSFINVAKGAINKESKEVQDFISFYTKLTGKKVGEGSCKDCILDAYFELSTKTPNQLKILLMEKSYSLKKNKVVGFGGSHYTKDNMTDAVAFEMVRSNRSNAAHFENPEQLLKDYDAATVKAVTDSFKGIENANKIPLEHMPAEKSATDPVEVVPENLTVIFFFS